MRQFRREPLLVLWDLVFPEDLSAPSLPLLRRDLADPLFQDCPSVPEYPEDRQDPLGRVDRQALDCLEDPSGRDCPLHRLGQEFPAVRDSLLVLLPR